MARVASATACRYSFWWWKELARFAHPQKLFGRSRTIIVSMAMHLSNCSASPSRQLSTSKARAVLWIQLECTVGIRLGPDDVPLSVPNVRA